MPCRPSLASACVGPMSGAWCLVLHRPASSQLLTVKNSCLQALKVGQRKGHLKPRCLSLWLGATCPETLSGLSTRACFSFSMASPTTKSQPLQLGEIRRLSPANLSTKAPLYYFPQRCHASKTGPARNGSRHNSYILLLIFFLKINQRRGQPIQRLDLHGNKPAFMLS